MNITRRYIQAMPLGFPVCRHRDWTALADCLQERQMANPTVIRNMGLIGGYDMRACRQLTDEIDQCVLSDYGCESAWPHILLVDQQMTQSIPTVHDGTWPYAWTPTYGPWRPEEE